MKVLKSNPYWSNILIASMTLYKGLKYTARHFFKAHKNRKPVGLDDNSYFKQQGLSTLQYPHESFPIPDNGRYRLHNEMEDCIVCDKCAKVCPVDCIDIEPIRATEEIGKTSDGTPKRIHAALFDIDMAKCCFCGLCTTVCPTECLTMTKAYEFSEYDVKEHNYAFSILNDEQIADKKKEFEEFEKEKLAAKAEKPAEESKDRMTRPVESKPIFKPKMKPVVKKEGNTEQGEKKKPVFKPRMKPVIKKESKDAEPSVPSKPQMRAKPVMKKPDETQQKEKPKAQPKPVIRIKKDKDE